eukprot:TRINITY_DN9272_c0_g2_i1.p1 TRINITY_DN9272_c0_g2~~TRINITY_DN9272_c0_g2_i1.p1  ORF type:complete len:1004 (-),score=188.51 TRINITY_DN9272_c0_g2_i1:59-3070(-)
MMTRTLSLLVGIVLLASVCEAVFPGDAVVLPSYGGQQFYLANETYRFVLLEQPFMVPHQLRRHILYTASTQAVTNNINGLLGKKRSIELSTEEYQLLSQILTDVPSSVRVNHKKRSVTSLESGVKVIKLTEDASVTLTPGFDAPTLKRGLSGANSPVLCLHIPFLTTCDNKVDLDQVKSVLKTAVDSVHVEIDSYKKTNDARANALAKALNEQKSVINSMIAYQTTVNKLVAECARSVQLNAAQIADGDFQAHSQINYLKRVTHSLLKYANALGSTDPRAVVAQPSLSTLFTTFLSSIQYLQNNSYIPILDFSNTFTWTETLLPAQSVQNTVPNPCLSYSSNPCTLQPQKKPFVNFHVSLQYSCSQASSNTDPVCPVTPSAVDTTHWIYGPFHKSHYGIYTVPVTLSTAAISTAHIMKPVINPISGSIAQTNAITDGTSYCVQFLGYKMLTSFSSTPSMVNGIPATVSVDDADCNVLRLVNAPGVNVYSLYAEWEGVVIPFYTNCDISTFKSDIAAISNSTYPILSSINYACSNAWTNGTSHVTPSACGTVPKMVTNFDVYLRHYVGPTCYTNIEPAWLELDYYVPPLDRQIPNIPRGFKLQQFTVNPDGELSSSIEFLYTDTWLKTYTIERISDNFLIADEISLMEGSPVLFHLGAITGSTVTIIDESDKFFGTGNNGRDCVRKDLYNYSLFNCFYQNTNNYYKPDNYLKGLVKTSGIARYNDKFTFSLDYVITDTHPDGLYEFTLTPVDTADFTFSVQMNGTVCPKVIDQQALSSNCYISLFYSDKDAISLVGTNTHQTINIHFADYQGNASLAFDEWMVYAGSNLCFGFSCSKSSSFSTVKLITPKFEVVSKSDLALQATIDFSISKTIESTMTSMNAVLSQSAALTNNLTDLKDRLANISFNVTGALPYEDFTAYRQMVDQLINAISPPANESSSSMASNALCTPFSSAACFFQNFGSALIGLAIIGVLGGLALLAYQQGLFNKLCSNEPEDEFVSNGN